MPIPFKCPDCGFKTSLDEKRRGCRIECPACGTTDWVPQQPPPKQVSKIKRIMKVFGVVVFLGLVVLLLLPAQEGAKEPARRMQCMNNVKNFCLAMHIYHDEFEVFPLASGPIITGGDEEESVETYEWSWRVRILPYIEQQELYDKFHFDEPWDSDHNLAVAETMPDVYQCSSDPSDPKDVNGHLIPVTNYVMITGPNTIGSADGVEVAMSDVSDGLSNTLLIVEVTGDYRPAWTEPVDISITDLRRNINAVHGKSIGSPHPGGANAGFVDGSVHFLSETMPPYKLQLGAQINDGEVFFWD
jgi:prepilin-type processing-associated H-X9-DG protein